MGFLGDLSDQISSQFNLGENTTTSLDSIVNGENVKYGSLGDFASKFDQSATRNYVEEGYLRRDPYNTDPKQMEILLQEPSATIMVKKRMFSSVGENFRPDFMDDDEKIYYKAMRILFQNKCNQIAALEKLSKIQKISSAVGQIDTQLIPYIITLADTINNGLSSGTDLLGTFNKNINPLGGNQDPSKFVQIVDRLRTLYAYNSPNQYTTWITDATNMFQSSMGQGTGVIEITNFTSIETNVSVKSGQAGDFRFTVVDPYESMLITDYDIEKALSDATNSFYNKKTFQFGVMSADQVISDTQNQLNSIRASRQASPITFKVDPDTLLGKRVTAIIDGTGQEIIFTYDATGGTGFPGLGGSGNSVSVSDDYLRGGAIAGFNGLDTVMAKTGNNNIKRFVSLSELTIFGNMIAAIFNKLQLLANSAGALLTHMDLTNYARKKLRFAFSGQLLIQPMDTVHIYMTSKSRFDNKILSGLQQMFSGVGILQNFNHTITDLSNSIDSLFRPSGSIPLQVEKSIYVGASFPNYLWSLVRNQFVTEKEGTHVFAGVVDRSVDTWSDGKFTINISGKDNTAYFDQGKNNFQPGADAFCGAFYDPLTPFKSNFDSTNGSIKSNTPELLDENKALLGDKSALSLVKYKLGPHAGSKTTQANYLQDRNVDPFTGRLTKVFYAPDGLVYKWKEGIGVFTQFGSSNDTNNPNLVGNPNIFVEPFAGLDVMNVLSLLITGVPYNFSTYYKTTGNPYGFTSDPQSQQNAAQSFAASLRNDLAKRNSLWGNFIPFKNLTMNESTIAQALKAQASISKIDASLDSKFKKLAILNQQIAAIGAVNILSSKAKENADATDFTNLKTEADNLMNEINVNISSIEAESKQFSKNNNGLDATFDTNQLIDGKSNPSNTDLRKYLRRQINYLTRRMSYEVRANQDKNLFIVDDYYDVDYDISAFNQALANGIQLYNNEFTSVREKINAAASLLNLEVFCDTQGHIRVRSPQYNRMPSSIFYRMLNLKKTTGVQVYPQFIDDLFGNQLNTLREKIEVLEDQIRLDCAILGHKATIESDDDTVKFIASNSGPLAGGLGGSFQFISSPTGLISDIDILLTQANQDLADSKIPTGLSDYDNIKNAGTSTKTIFGNTQRYALLRETLKPQVENITQFNSVVQSLITRINTKSGQKLTTKDYIVSTSGDSAVQSAAPQTVDFFKVTREISEYITSWQSAIKLFYHTLKNSVEYKALNNNPSVGIQMVTPGNYRNSHIPEILEHMIEDESYDDYGPGSGQRYIIKRAHIKNLTIEAAPPPFTSVEVHGILNTYAPGELPAELKSFPGGGNGLVTAFAIDYDLWRNYGFKQGAKIDVPFLSNPESQCAPFAAMILSRNRAEVIAGSITISGNEYMQPGEVVYLQDRQMLFYVNSVRHSFQEGSGFTTTMDLGYGHTPGDYIPTYLDSIGKLIYKNRDVADMIIQRQDSSGPDSSLGVVQLDGSNPNAKSPINSGSEDDYQSSFSNANMSVINNILYKVAFAVNQNGAAGHNIETTVELRIYHDNNTSIDNNLSKFATTVAGILTGSISGPKIDQKDQNSKNPTLPSKSVKIVEVTLDTVDANGAIERKSPSQKAIDAARNQIKNSSSNSGKSIVQNDALRKALFSYIIDCWVNIKQVQTT